MYSRNYDVKSVAVFVMSCDKISDVARHFVTAFSLIPDNEMEGGLIRHASKTQANNQQYGCGCFWFQKETN